MNNHFKILYKNLDSVSLRATLKDIENKLNKTEKLRIEVIEENERLNNIINDKKERQDIAIRLLQKMFGTDDYEINYIIGIINGQRQIKFDEKLKEGKK